MKVVTPSVASPAADQTSHDAGGRLPMAVINSVWWRRGSAPIEQLADYPALVGLVAQAGWLDTPAALIAAARNHPRRAASALQRSLELREALYRIFSAVIGAKPAADPDLSTLNAAVSDGAARLVVAPNQAGALTLGWPESPPELDLPCWQIALSAALLLTSTDFDRVKQCPGETCGWVFLDTTRNANRRWCDSRQCGNRQRVRAHYLRTHATSSPQTPGPPPR